MARRSEIVTITAEGRDKGKSFLITEKSAAEAEDWVAEAFAGMLQGGVDIPDEVISAGAAGLVAIGIRGLQALPWATAKPLYDRLMTCVQTLPNPGDRSVVRFMIDTDTEEVATRLKLRFEVLKLHADFSSAAVA